MIRGVRAAVMCGYALCLFSALATLPGCGGGGKPPSPARLEIENVSKWWTLFLARHNRKPPKDDAEFQAFVEKTLQERGDAFDRNAIFVSPRDNKEWVIRYGPETAKLSENAVIVHEQDGYDGKILVATVGNRSYEIEKAELPTQLAIE